MYGRNLFVKLFSLFLFSLISVGCSPHQTGGNFGWLLLLGGGGSGSSSGGGGATGPGTLSTPSFSPTPGTYSSNQSVTITSDSGTTIYYTTDGSTPTTSSAVYSSAIPFSATLNLKAYAVKSGLTDSPVAMAAYSVSLTNRTVSFPQAMKTSITPTLLAEAYDGSAWNAIPTTGTTFSWSDSQTLVLHISWKQLPENTQLRFTVSGLQDSGGNTVANDVQVFTTGIVNGAYALADTGQTTCYDNTAPLGACGNASFPGQDGEFANTPNARSFTGPTAPGSYPSDYTTTDNVTGLIWKSCTEGLSGAGCASGTAGTFTWYNAVNACAALNTANSGAGYAGRTDWRLPSMRELRTLPNYGPASAPAIDAVSFPNTQVGLYWSSSTYAPSALSAWAGTSGVTGILFSVNYPTKVGLFPVVRCLSAGPSTLRSFVDLNDGTVRDAAANLVWQRCSADQANDNACSGTAGTRTWQSALSYCRSLNLAGRNWRLPSMNELKSLVNEGRSSPAIDLVSFPNTQNSVYWTSSTMAASISGALCLHFNDGNLASYSKTAAYSVRCVSAGP